MKKVLSIMACMVMVLVGGIALASCGSDEFAGAEKISADDMSTFLASDAYVTDFNGYTMTSSSMGVDMTASVAIVDDKLQASLTMSAKASSEYGAVSMRMYLLNDVVYVDGGKDGKVKLNYDPSNEALASIKGALEFSSDLKGIIESTFTEISNEILTIKKLEEENTTKFLIETRSDTIYGTMVYSMKLVYVDNTLAEINETVKIGKTVFSQSTIKAFSGNVQFPANLETDSSYVSGN